jgi:murein DD-endopeptidase MepM/ murein hydrolase activator NlpD
MRKRVVAVALACAALLAGLAVELPRRFARQAPPPAIPAGPVAEPAPATPAAASETDAAPEPPPIKVETVELERGDTLVGALARGGIAAGTANEIARLLRKSGADLRRLHPGDTVTITWSGARPVAIAWEASAWLAFSAEATESGWEVRRVSVAPDVRVEPVRGEVLSSLFQAVEDVRESPQLVLRLVEIFSSDFDFTADTKPGDRFRLLVEKRYAGDRFVEYGRILVAQYVAAGRTLTGIGFERAGRGRFGYYDPAGRSLRKSFLKSPLEFTRITSGFTYARPHPILGGVRPHLAIDYAAPVGTPVRAVADATVTSAGWDGGNGLSVLLSHRSGYRTMYNHLSRLATGVRRGVRVAQRQVIGYVGMTGLATGPHLDYRVAKNGVWVNPLSETFIPGDPVQIAERSEFLTHAKALITRLERDAAF